MAFIWCPVCQATSHVGAAGVGMISPFSMPSIALAEFKRHWEMGSALHGILLSGSGRIGFQGADQDPEKLALTELHFQAVFCEAVKPRAMASPVLLREVPTSYR